MSKPYTMRRAIQDDYPAVMNLLNDRRKWLRDRGSDQWNVGREFESRTADSIDRGETWLMVDDGTPIATIIASPQGDPDFWTSTELHEPALYIGKMATSLNRRGEKLGTLLVRWAQDQAFQLHLSLVRWDAWRSNSDLHHYYRSIGARYVRTEDVTTRWSGALFEIDAGQDLGLAQHLRSLDTGF